MSVAACFYVINLFKYLELFGIFLRLIDRTVEKHVPVRTDFQKGEAKWRS